MKSYQNMISNSTNKKKERRFS